jgi:hypothetical protein
MSDIGEPDFDEPDFDEPVDGLQESDAEPVDADNDVEDDKNDDVVAGEEESAAEVCKDKVPMKEDGVWFVRR